MFNLFKKRVTEESCGEISEKAEKSVSDFISVTAHQLKTPFTSIKWAIELMQKGEAGPITEDQKILLQKMHSSTLHASRLISEMLNAYRLEAGSTVFDFELADDIADVLKRSIEEIRTLAENKKIKIETEISSELPTNLYVDHSKIEDVFQILLENAIKYTNDGGQITVKFSLNKEGATFSFADSGIGISKDSQVNIFKKFFRTYRANEKEHDGSGLGLFIAKSIIEKHQGQISFQSEENKGTTFFVTLPFGPKK